MSYLNAVRASVVTVIVIVVVIMIMIVVVVVIVVMIVVVIVVVTVIMVMMIPVADSGCLRLAFSDQSGRRPGAFWDAISSHHQLSAVHHRGADRLSHRRRRRLQVVMAVLIFGLVDVFLVMVAFVLVVVMMMMVVAVLVMVARLLVMLHHNRPDAIQAHVL